MSNRSKGRYCLICQGEIILDKFRHEVNEGKDGYDLSDHYRYGGKVPEDLYSKEELVEKLNWYDRQVNENLYDDPVTMQNFEDRVFPCLNQRITQCINDLPLYESRDIKVSFNDLDYNTGRMEQYHIECKVKHTDETGYINPSLEELKKDVDDYTLTKVLIELNHYIDEFCNTQDKQILLYGLRARLMTMG